MKKSIILLLIILAIIFITIFVIRYKNRYTEGFAVSTEDIRVGLLQPNSTPNTLGNKLTFPTTRPTDTENLQLPPNVQNDDYPKIQVQLTNDVYPLFADTIPSQTISPVDDMPSISDQYLQIDNKYKYDGSRYTNLPDNIYLLDDGKSGNMGTLNNMCSKSCCAPQWPVPFKLNDTSNVCNNSDIVGSNYACNSTFQNAGCMCMTKEQALNITTRGGNAGKDILVY